MRFVYKYDIIYDMKNKNFLAILIATLTIFIFFVPHFKRTSAQTDIQDNMKNTVALLTFESEGSNFEPDFENNLLKCYTTSRHSVRNYLLKQSGGKVRLQAQLLKAKSGVVVRSNHGVNYYKPRYEWINGSYKEINAQGYDNRYYTAEGKIVKAGTQGALQSIESVYREQILIREVVEKLNVSTDYQSDLNGDGLADNLVIIVDCPAENKSEWGDILWPHTAVCHDFNNNVLQFYYQNESIGGYIDQDFAIPKLGNAHLSSYNLISSYTLTQKIVGDYNFYAGEDEKNLYNIGLLAHETLHVIGLSDYYSYEDSTYESVGEFDVMATTTVLPQNMLGYLRLKQGWLNYEDILYVNDSGRYELSLSTSEQGKKVAKIILNDYHESGEYFMAEFRSASLSTADNAYDGELSGDGLIIYRVNPQYAYINPSYKLGSVDYGNMYGKEEVFVYRFGDQKLKKLVGPLGQSYALLGGSETVITSAFEQYSGVEYGNLDKNKTLDDRFTSFTKESETLIYYSNGTNSGIKFSEISVDLSNKKVYFTVTLHEAQGDNLQLSKSNFILKNVRGKTQINWVSEVKDGNIQILVLKSTNRLKKQAEKGALKLTAKHFESAKYPLYKTLYSTSLPFAEKQITLENYGEEGLVFARYSGKSGEQMVYLGSIANPNITFEQYLSAIFDPLYLIIVPIVCVLAVVGCVFLFKYFKKSNEKNIVRK